MEQIQLLTTNSLCSNFPNTVENEINRDNIADIVETMLQKSDVVFISGEEDTGKTVFLAQFARKNRSRCISCFIKPVNKFSLRIENLFLDIISQVNFLLTGDDFDDEPEVNSEIVEKLLFKLGRSRKFKEIFIVLDGFELIGDKDKYLISNLFDFLPFAMPNFKFVISDCEQKVYNAYFKNKRLVSQEYPLAGFSLHECENYLKDKFNERVIRDLKALTNGLPGRLSVLYKLSDTGKMTLTDLEDLDSFNAVLQQQWEKIDLSDEKVKDILGFLAFEDINSATDLSKFLKIDIAELIGTIGQIAFLELKDDELISFTSSAFKKYAQKKLSHLKNQIEESVIRYYTEDVDKTESIFELPKRLVKGKKFEQLLRTMTDENFMTILNNKESLIYLEQHTSLGINAAKELNNHLQLYRLALHKSCIAEIKQTYVWTTEIEAKLNLKDFESAFTLSHQTPLKEEKFRIFAFLARKKKEMNLVVETEVLELLKALYEQIDIVSYYDDEQIANIASDLLFTLPELAISIMEKVSGKNNMTSDLGFARLFILMKTMKDVDSSETLEKINSKINDNSIRNLAKGFSFLYGSENADQFIKKCEELNNSQDKLHIVRIYIEENLKKTDITKVIHYGLDVLLHASIETPITATILKEISSPLPFIEIHEKLRTLLDNFSALKGTAKEKGPTLNYLHFLINIAIVRINIDPKEGANEFLEIYEEIDKITDTGLQLDSLSLFYKMLVLNNKNGVITCHFNFIEDIIEQSVADYKYIIENSSDHHDATSYFLKNICVVNPAKCLELIKSINTRDRRDKSHLVCLKTYLTENEDREFGIINQFYQQIYGTSYKNRATILVLETIADKGLVENQHKGDLKRYIDRVEDFSGNQDQFEAYLSCIKIVYTIFDSEKMQDDLIGKIQAFLNRLDDYYLKIDFGFIISSHLVKYNRNKAVEIHNYAERQKLLLKLDSPAKFVLYYNSLRLAFAAYKGVDKSSDNEEKRIENIIEYIRFIQSEDIRLELISKILYILDIQGKGILAKTIYDRYIKDFVLSLLTESTSFSKVEIYNILLNLSPLAYKYQKETFFEVIKLRTEKDHFLDAICSYLVNNQDPNDLHKKDDSDININIDTSMKIIDVISRMSTDVFINLRLKQLMCGVLNSNFPQDTLAIITNRMTEIVKEKLPDRNNIRHDGYKILCNAYILKLKKNSTESEWIAIIEEASSIPNNSDLALVKSIIASLIPSKYTKLKNGIIKDVLIAIENIKSYKERVNRYNDVFDSIKKTNSIECRNILNNAVRDSLNDSDGSLYQVQRDLIDLAYEYDTNLAEELLKKIDSDPGRKPISHRLKKRLGVLGLKSNIVNQDVQDFKNTKDLSEACSMLIGALVGNRISSKHLDKVSNWLLSAHNAPISETFPIYLCYIENINARFGKKEDFNTQYTEGIFDNCMSNVQLMKALSTSSSTRLVSDKKIISQSSDDFLIVKYDEREKALEFIKKWVVSQVVDYVKIIDPYFSHKDLLLIKEIFLLKPDIKFYILGQFDSQNANSGTYYNEWQKICDEEPPVNQVIMVGLRTNEEDNKNILDSPNHDRWYITPGSGLSVGTSFNRIGYEKNTAIKIMNAVDAKNIEETIFDKFLNEEEKVINGKKVIYLRFDF